MKRMTNVLRKFHLVKEQPESETRQRLKAELFACNSYGFPSKPTALAYDDKLELLAIGSKSGNIRIYGQPGVEFMASHSNYVSVTHIHFLCGQGRFVTLCNDNSIHLWQLETRDDKSVLEEVKGMTFDASKLKRVITCCFTETSDCLMLGTDAGNIYQLNITSFKLADKVIYRDSIVQHAPDELRTNSGCICALQRHPMKPSKFLVGFSRGLIVLLDVTTATAERVYNASLNLESLSFYNDGEEFVSAHLDGSYIIWSSTDSSRPKEQANTPYGPFPCKAIKKILWKATQSNPFVIFSGGMPRASHGDRNTVTVIYGSEHVVFDLTSKIIDFNLITRHVRNAEDSSVHYSLLILAEEEFVAIDLTSPGWPLHRLPYLDSIHASTILSASHVANVPLTLWSQIVAVGNQQHAQYSTDEWPIRGGKNLLSEPSLKDLLLTGHEDGTLRFWDVSSSCMRLLYKLSLSSMFGDDMSMSFDPCRTLDIEDEWPPFRRVGVYDPFSDDLQLSIQKSVLSCSDETLFISGSTGQVIILHLSTMELKQTVKVLPMHIIEEADRGLWRGRNPSKVKDGEVKFGAGFQPMFMVQIYPPAPCTALVANASRGLLALGTPHGFGVVDYIRQEVLYAKSTLEPLLVEEIATVPQRRRSIKKSLRESFRRLRNGKVSMRRRSRSHAGDSMRTTDDERPRSQPVSLVVSAAGSRSYESEAENDVQLIDFRQIPTAVAAGCSSSRASLAALTPPATPRRAATSKKLELRSADGLTASVVRSLYFADTFVVDGENCVPSLWVGTNGGVVFIHQLIYMTDAKDQGPIQCRCFLAKQIHLRHHSPILSICVIDRFAQLVHESATEVRPEQSETPSSGHQAVICTEQQIKMFSLPSLKTAGKCRISSQNGVKLRQANVVEFRSRSDEQYVENCIVGLTSSAEVHVIGLPNLSHQLKADKFDIDGSLNASLFTRSGEFFFLHSPSEYARQSLSARHVIQPQCLVDVAPGSRPPLQLVSKSSEDRGYTSHPGSELCASSAAAAPTVNGSAAGDVPGNSGAMPSSNPTRAGDGSTDDESAATGSPLRITSNGVGTVDLTAPESLM